ncbi:DUF6542 domain-containing protein [Thermopolyspora sp. NPDC052614]|uniref:DUF6542 domain-containing protein n=1 Tax=Thermopolyspora sp. NPDC052614 TaxID=3155682 RepID=UPI0034457755
MSGIRLTARGAIALVFTVTLVACVTGSSAVIGAAFVVACLAGVMLIQPRELLALVVTPPLTFFVAMLVNELIRSLGAASFLQAFGLGMFTSLSGGAPWLFAGSALVLAVAWFRGLPANVRELRDELRAARPERPPSRPSRGRGQRVPETPEVPRPRRGGRTGYAPEPEGYFEPRVYGSARDT